MQADLIFDISNKIDKKVDGKLMILDWNRHDFLAYNTCSGGYGNGYLPSGEYKINVCTSLEDVSENAPYKKELIPWFVPLEPMFKTERTGLGIHPDGNVPGSLGCIAITKGDMNCFKAIKILLKKKGSLCLKVV